MTRGSNCSARAARCASAMCSRPTVARLGRGRRPQLADSNIRSPSATPPPIAPSSIISPMCVEAWRHAGDRASRRLRALRLAEAAAQSLQRSGAPRHGCSRSRLMHSIALVGAGRIGRIHAANVAADAADCS